MQELLISPLRLEPHSSLPLPPVLFGAHAGARKNSTGLDLTVPTMREPLMAALASTTVPVVPEFNTQNTASAFAAAHASYKQWSKTAVAERATVLRRAADTMLEQTPAFCALLVKEAHKTWGDAVSEVREAVDFLRYYADEAERIMQPMAMPQVHGVPPALASYAFGVTGETNTLSLTARGVWVCISPWNFRWLFCRPGCRGLGHRQHRAGQTGRANAGRGPGCRATDACRGCACGCPPTAARCG
ncbi:aldehyde dehydrogenase family protein [Rhodoferax sp. AJA081-3]|uniref:aldehyde dehydrogenase family protein n=1 Tax=Rhodoferax sp. AJA081-3 TaxID=2752316 RepID=UPI003530461D